MRIIKFLLFIIIPLIFSCAKRFDYNDIDDFSLYRGKSNKLYGGFYGNYIHGVGEIKLKPYKSIHLYQYKLLNDSLVKYFVSPTYIDSLNFKRRFSESVHHKWLTKDSLESIEISNEVLPSNYLDYFPNYHFPIQSGWYRIVNSDTKAPVILPIKEYTSKRFPHKFYREAIEGPYIYRNPTILGCSRKCNWNGCCVDSLNWHYPLVEEFLIFNPSSEFYIGSVFTLWNKDYRAYLNCKLMQCSDFEYTKIECNKEAYEENRNNFKFWKLKNKEIEDAQRNLIKTDVEKYSLEMHKSYFQLVLWYLYRPKDFDVPFNFGNCRSLRFTSNNPEYPGNYEVKFNIYQPYYFKVFKR